MRHRSQGPWPLATLLLSAVVWVGCGGTGGDGASPTRTEEDLLAGGPGSVPVGVEFLFIFENQRTAAYYPIEGLAGVDYAADGTLIFCDDKRGMVFGLNPRTQLWYEFDDPGQRPYRPVDIRVDGFKALVLDIAGRTLHRFDLGGAYQDQLANFRRLDPAYDTIPAAFDVDLDGRMVVADGGESQVLVVDSFLNPQARVGNPGPHREQFNEPSGIVFLPDGGFLVSDRGNRRVQRFNRLGYFEAIYGGEFDLDNPFVAPQGVDVDRWGNAFVADPAAGRVHVLDRRGRLLFSLGSDLSLLATPETPMDTAVGPDDRLAVTDRTRSAILVYRILYD